MKKLSKRLLSVLLAALLIVASVPLFAMSASAAEAADAVRTIDTADVSALKTALDNYISTMSTVSSTLVKGNYNSSTGTGLYSTAYSAYVAAYKIYDAALYGSFTNQSAINTAATALSNATSALSSATVWTQSTATATYRFSGDSSSYTIPGSDVAGLLYASSVATNSSITTDSSDGNLAVRAANPAVVVGLYDGSTIKIPVMVAWRNTGSAGGYSRQLLGWYPTDASAAIVSGDNPYLYLTTAWTGKYEKGTKSTGVESFQWQSGQSSSHSHTLVGYNYSTSQSASGDTSKRQGGNASYYKSQGNTMYYRPGTFTAGLQAVNLGWSGRFTRWNFAGLSQNQYNLGVRNGSSGNTYYFIDYKTTLDAMSDNKSKLKFNLGDYANGELNNFMLGFDKATIDVTNTGMTDSNAGSLAGDLAAILADGAEKIKAAIPTNVAPLYKDLRAVEAFTGTTENKGGTAREVYKQGITDAETGEDKWSAETWRAFTAAFEAAMDAFNSAQSGSYSASTNFTALIKNVKDTYDALAPGGISIQPVLDAYADLITALTNADRKYLASDLKAINTAFAGATITKHQYYTEDADYIAPSSEASDVEAEEAAIKNVIPVAVENFDVSAFDTYLANEKAKANDPDAYNINEVIESVNALENDAFETVTVNVAGIDIIGLTADAQDIVDNIETRALSLAPKSYTVTTTGAAATIKDASGKTYANGASIPYGTAVSITTGSEADYTYDYVSNTSNKEGSHIVQYIGTTASFDFNVVGNTTVKVADPTAANVVKVTYYASSKAIDGSQLLGFTAGTEYVTAGTTVDATKFTPKSYANFDFSGYDKTSVKTEAGKDVTITLNYNYLGNVAAYKVIDAENDYGDDGYEYSEYDFNEVVTYQWDGVPAVGVVEDTDAADYYFELIDMYPDFPYTRPENAWEQPELIDITPFIKVVAYGDTYTFRVREDLVLVPIYDLEAYDSMLIKDTDDTGAASDISVNTVQVLSGSTVTTYNSIALPEDCKFVEAGVLTQYNKTGDALVDRALSFENAGNSKDIGADKIRRVKATAIHTEEDNRYTINLKLNCTKANVKYVAYVNYKDADGKLHTVFSQPQYASIG